MRSRASWFPVVVLLGFTGCATGTNMPGPQSETQCSDGYDNDGDGRTDCFDLDCSNDPGCQPAVELCSDGIDNDNDLRIDCADSDCAADPACQAGNRSDAIGSRIRPTRARRNTW